MDKTRHLTTLTCKYCKTLHRYGELFCHDCGKPLYERHELQSPSVPVLTDEHCTKKLKPASLHVQALLKLHLIDEDVTLVVQSKKQILLGRHMTLDTHANEVDIDLVPFNGFAKGVSRIHAVIQGDSDLVYLIDQGSKNGTLVNGIHLVPLEPYLVADGDIAYLGCLPIRFNISVF